MLPIIKMNINIYKLVQLKNIYKKQNNKHYESLQI